MATQKPLVILNGVVQNISSVDAIDIACGGTGATTAPAALIALGIGNVENKSSTTIRSELTSTDVTTALGFTPSSGSNASVPLTLINTNTTATAGGNYVFTGNCTLLLPAAPSANDAICFSNRSGVLTCKLGSNGLKIMGIADDLTLDSLTTAYGRLVYANATLGWIFI